MHLNYRKDKRLAFVLWGCYLMMLALLTACSDDKQDKKFTVAFSQCIGSDAWRTTMLNEMKRELSFHPEIEFVYLDADGNTQKQIEQVKNLASYGIDLLIISPNEAEPLTPYVDEIFQQGIPVIVTDRKTSSGLYNAYVGASNYEIGYMAGQYISTNISNNATLVTVTGLPTSSASMERQRGFSDALSNTPSLKVTKSINGEWLKEKAYDAIAKDLTDFQQVDAVFAFNDQMALGAYNALKPISQKKDIKIIGVDALPGEGNGLEQVSKGYFEASMLYATGGKEAINTAIAILDKKPYKRENLLGTLAIDKSNVGLMQMQSEKIESQQLDIDKQQALLAEQTQIYQSQQIVLNVLVVSLVLAIVFAGIAFYSLKANWKKNALLENQNAEIKKQQEQLLHLNHQVQQATEAKINFFTNLSHEFKTPLTLILSPLQDLLENKSFPVEINNQLSMIKKHALRLTNLVTQLIDIRRTDSEILKLRAHPQHIFKFLNQIFSSYKTIAIKRNISLSIENNLPNPILWFDTDLMEKVVYNLLSNAFKFTPDNGKIQIKLESNTFGDFIFIRFLDNGKGINKASIDHIFEPFFQATSSKDGSGIGLALVKDIVELHHGQITVSSKENHGSCFTLRLPVGDAHLKEEEKWIGKPSVKTVVNTDHYLAELRTAMTPLLELGDGQYSILLVDDNVEMLGYLQQQLATDCKVYTATSASNAFELVLEKIPDLIITDIVMEGGSGLELVKQLKHENRTAHIPVILLTARDSEEHKQAGLETLADMYLTKPIGTTYLKAAIQNLIHNRESLKTRFASETTFLNRVADQEATVAEKRFLNNLSAIVEANLSNSQFTVDHIARDMGISRVQLYRKTRSLMDCSVNDYIVTRRLKKAKVLLQEELTINEVAYQTGFSSPTYFSTAFKNKYGDTPSSYRRSLGNKKRYRLL